MFHAVAQCFKQRRQAANHFSTLFARHLGSGRPDEVGGGALHRFREIALRAVLHRSHRQHVGPDLEQELANPVLDRHFVEHLAQLDGVLDRHRFALFNLLRQRHAALGRFVLVLEIMLEKALELREHGLEDAPTGVGVSLHDLDDALDFLFEHVTDSARRRIETHHARAHAVNEASRRVIHCREEIGLAHRHTQYWHLQPGEPDAHRGRNSLLGQDTLKQQSDDLDRGTLDLGRSGLLERLLALVQFLEQCRRIHGLRTARPCWGGETPSDTALGFADSCIQRRRGPAAIHVLRRHEFGQLPADKLIQLAQDFVRMVYAARKGARIREHAGFFSDRIAPPRGRGRPGHAKARRGDGVSARHR